MNLATGKQAWLVALGLCLCTWLTYLPWLGRQEFVGTEDFRARIAWEMQSVDHWGVPTYYGRPILTKPPMHYWALGRIFTWTGEMTPLTARLLSLTALAATVGLLGYFGARAGGTQAGWIAGLGYLLAANTLKNGVNAEIDPLFAFFTVAGVLFWGAWCLRPAAGLSGWFYALAVGISSGCAILTKGPAWVVFAFPAVAASWRMGRLPDWKKLFLTCGLTLFVGLSWPIWLWVVDPTLEGAINETASKAVAWDYDAVRKTMLFPLALIGASAPFSLAACWKLNASGRAPLDRYLLYTVCGAFLLLGLSAGKATRYLLPCFSMLVLAAALRLELLQATGRALQWIGRLLLALTPLFMIALFQELGAWGWVSLAGLGLSAYLNTKWGTHHAAICLLTLVLFARLCVTQVYVPYWSTREDSASSVAEKFLPHLRDVSDLAVARLETPRVLEPLARDIVYFDKPKDLIRALQDGEEYSAILINWKREEESPAGYREVEDMRIYGKHLKLFLPE